jgi:hypothetical protein
MMNIKYLYIIIFFTQITSLKSQTDAWPVGGYWTMGVNTQFYVGRRHLSDALIALPRQGSYFEWGADLYRNRRWGLYVRMRNGRASDDDQSVFDKFARQKYPNDYLQISPQQEPMPLMQQYLLGARWKIGQGKFQVHPAFALGVTKFKSYQQHVAAKGVNTNALYITTLYWQDVPLNDYKPHLTIETNTTCFWHLRRRWWVTGSAGLMLVKLASNRLTLRTTDEVTGLEDIETLKNPLFRVGASITVGLVYRVGAIF